MKVALIAIAIFLIPVLGKGQNVGIGADLMYNFQTESAGAGIRASIFPTHNLSITPEIAYYPGFNLVNEYYISVALEDKLFKVKNYLFYIIGQVGFDNWINFSDSPMKGAKPDNFDLEGGGGVTTNKCLRPFLECRYNAVFRECNMRLGILYIIGCGGGGEKTKRSSDDCPKF